MGCGSSKMGVAGGDEVGPAGIRPLLRRRLEEMKKRSQASVLKGDQTLSKKELLKHHGGGGSEGEETEHDGSMRSAKVAPVPDHDEVHNKEVVYEEVKEKVLEVVIEREEDDHDNHDDDDDDHDNVHDGIHVCDDVHDGLHEEVVEEEVGRMSDFHDERMICAGSPSFKVYCIHLSDDESEDKDREEVSDRDGEEKKLQTENGTIAEEPKSVKMEKKVRKGRRFSIPMPKASASRKYLFSPCYSGADADGRCKGNPNARLVQEKSSTN